MQNRTSRLPRWALVISSAVTFFAAAMLILAIILGLRAGQEQLTIKRRQQVSLILDQAFSYHNQGKVEAARIAYEEVLLLDPDNNAATEGLTHLRGGLPADLAAQDNSQSNSQSQGVTTPITDLRSASTPAITITPAIAGSAVVALPTTAATATTSTTMATSSAEQFATAREAFNAGRWTQAIEQLLALRAADKTYQQSTVNQLLFESYVNLATEKDNQNKLQEAVALFDNALALQPDATTIRTERALIIDYIDAITYAGADWERALDALQSIYAIEPAYRDVEERLQRALIAQGELLATAAAWCEATTLLDESIAIGITAGVVDLRDEYREACATDGASVADAQEALAEDEGEASEETAEGTDDPTPARAPATGAPTVGTILYSALDATSRQSRVVAQPVDASSAASTWRTDAAQPALRQDGVRLLYRNLRNDMAGLSAWDPGSDLLLRFTQYAEDALPSWNPQGNRFVFASNREGDRLWRIYVAWAESNGETTTLSVGEAPAWHPTADQIAFRGCDNTGNRCGIWLINSSGGSRAPLTTVAADTRPAWSPTGRHVIFMSNGRDGNFELYRVDTNTQQILRLTENSAADLLPTVSPDGQWVAFASNRDGAWKLWAVPIEGGTPTLIAPIAGDLGDWTAHSLQWLP